MRELAACSSPALHPKRKLSPVPPHCVGCDFFRQSAIVQHKGQGPLHLFVYPGLGNLDVICDFCAEDLARDRRWCYSASAAAGEGAS